MKDQLEQIKHKIRAWSEEYAKKLGPNTKAMRHISKKESGKEFVAGKIAMLTTDDNSFKALFAEELKEGICADDKCSCHN